jgi:hypothetical protein
MTKDLNRKQTRWAKVFATYDLRIKYIKGTENTRADILNQKPGVTNRRPFVRNGGLSTGSGRSLGLKCRRVLCLRLRRVSRGSILGSIARY